MQREFRGFAETTVRSVGDSNSPTSESRSEFLLGKKPAELEVWEDNPHEALKGLPSIAETYDPATGVYLSTTGTTYELRKLYDGEDGRSVYVAFAKRTRWYEHRRERRTCEPLCRSTPSATEPTRLHTAT